MSAKRTPCCPGVSLDMILLKVSSSSLWSLRRLSLPYRGLRLGFVVLCWPGKPFETVTVIKGYINTFDLTFLERDEGWVMLRPTEGFSGGRRLQLSCGQRPAISLKSFEIIVPVLIE